MKKLITLSCLVIYAITAHAQNKGDYRTIASGNWTDFANVWQKYNGSNWVTATTYPTSTDGLITVRDGNDVTINLSLALDQTIVSGGASLILAYSGYTVSLNNAAGTDITIDGQFNWSAGIITGAGNILINNLFQWTGGTLQSALTNKGTVSIGFVYLASVFTNNGTVNWFYNSDIRFNGGTFDNNGTFNALGTGTLYNYTNGGTFNNNGSGSFNITNTSYMTNNIVFNNKGTMNFMHGTFYNYSGTFTNTKTMNFSGGVYQNRGTANINDGTKVTGTGSFSSIAYTINFNGAVSLPSGITVSVDGNSNIAGTGSLTINGILNWNYGSLSIPVTIQSSGTAYIYNYNGYLYNSLTNNGTINWNGYNIKFYNGSITNNGNFNIYSDDVLAPYNSSITGSFTNSATGVVTKNSIGTTTVNIPFKNKGKIKGVGVFAFAANLTNTSTFLPGAGSGTGILTTGTNYADRILSIQLNDASPGLGFDRLVVNGNAVLGNSDTLKVTASDNMPPGAYAILTCTGTRLGNFKVKQLPAGYTVSYQSNKVIINVPAAFTNNGNEAQAKEVIKSTNNYNNFLVFPNPASNILNYYFKGMKGKAEITILNSNGAVIKKHQSSSGEYGQIHINDLASGTYLLQVSNGDKTQTVKFIKQ